MGLIFCQDFYDCAVNENCSEGLPYFVENVSFALFTDDLFRWWKKKIGHQFCYFSCCSMRLQPRDALHPAHPGFSISTWGALSRPLQSQSFWQPLQFFHIFPTYFQRICIWLLMALRVKHLFQSEGIKGNFWLGSVAAGGTVCTWIFTFGSKGRH